MEKCVLVIDSGVGGLSIFKKLRAKFLSENFIYILDNDFSPYGNKSKTTLRRHICEIIDKYTINYDIKLIVFACNTLTATTIGFVREKYKINFVGTEPPIKKVSKNEKTLLLATKQTIKHSKLLKKYRNNKNIKFVPLKNVAKLLDENFFDRENLVKSLQKQIKTKKVNNVVLGCTHYYFLKNEIQNVIGHKVTFYDAIEGVLKRCETFLVQGENVGKTKIELTKPCENLEKMAKLILEN